MTHFTVEVTDDGHQFAFEELLDDQRLGAGGTAAESYLAPQRFAAWTEAKQLLVIIDLSIGVITRCRAGIVPTRELAESRHRRTFTKALSFHLTARTISMCFSTEMAERTRRRPAVTVGFSEQIHFCFEDST
ncbi:MAG: hypothetical protein IPH83_07135 [Gammaproteobacteria bacterium]|nr:hypothetical protein [Gammaproteobacteria bacterium]